MEINIEALNSLSLADLIAIRDYAAKQSHFTTYTHPEKAQKFLDIRYACVVQIEKILDNIFIF